MQSLSTIIEKLNKPTTKSEERSIDRILGVLIKSEQRNAIQHSKGRKHERVTVRGTAFISLQTSVNQASDIYQDLTLKAKYWSISQSGAAFVFAGNLNKDEIIIGFGTPEVGINWYHSKVVRKRKIPNTTIWEYGVEFQEKINS